MSVREDYRVPPQVTAADWNRFASRFLVKDEGIDFGDGTLFLNQAERRVGVGTQSPQETLHIDGNLRVDGNIIPEDDGVGEIGADDRRWSRVRAVNIVSGDYVFENGWRLTEAEKLGLGEGVALIDRHGRVKEVWK